MGGVRHLPTGNIVYGELPRGCQLCQRGLKTVVFLTGLCPANCFYCPLSRQRRNRDVMYVNEKPVDTSQPPPRAAQKVLSETILSASLGAGITGGDPLSKPQRTIWLIKLLKEKLGQNFHIHLYTSAIQLTPSLAKRLADAGLDELRIHAPPSILRDRLRTAVKTGGFTVGLEYPALPNGAEQLKNIIRIAHEEGASFVNINELEFTETNAAALKNMGYTLSPDYKTATGSRQAALQALTWAAQQKLPITVHFCPAHFKDHYQTGLRLYRRAQLTAQPHQLVTDDGTTLEVEYPGNKYPGIYPPHHAHIALAHTTGGTLTERSAGHRNLIVTREKIER